MSCNINRICGALPTEQTGGFVTLKFLWKVKALMKTQYSVVVSLIEDNIRSTEFLLVVRSTLIHFKKTPSYMIKKGQCLNVHFKETHCRKGLDIRPKMGLQMLRPKSAT